jgi:uncharacterized protein HemX
MKEEALQVSGSVVPAPSTQADSITSLLTHPQVQAFGRNGRLSARDKALVLAGAHVAAAEIYEHHRNSGPERVVKALFLQRWFSAMFGPSQEAKPKSLTERMGAMLPILAVLTIALAGLITAETSSWKGASEARKDQVDTLKDQLGNANTELKKEREKSDNLQNEMNNLLRDAAKQKTDSDTLARKIKELQDKYKTLTTSAPKQSAPSAGTTPGQ